VEAVQAPETLVHAIRQLRRAGDEEGARDVAELLIERAQDLFARAAAQFPLSSDDRAELVQTASLQLWREVFDTSPREEFWEVHFYHMVTCACSDAADGIWERLDKEFQFRRGEDDEGEPFDEEGNLADTALKDTDLLVAEKLFVAELLGQLEGNVRRAAYLRMLGYKEHSKNPDELTIAKSLGVSDRTVRTYLRKAEDVLRAWWSARRAQADLDCQTLEVGSNELEGNAS
jgi:hypothetical protein